MANVNKYGDLKGDIKFKEEFLNKMKTYGKLSEGYVSNTEVILRRFGEWEEENGKDLYDFNQSQIDDMLYGMKLGSAGETRRVRTTLKKYLIYARGKKLGNMSLDVTEFFKGRDIERYAWKNVQQGKIISLEELKNIVDGLINPRDKAIMWLLWLGVMGKNFDMIRKLKKTDVLWDNNAIVLVDEENNTERIIENIPDEVMNILKEARDENKYEIRTEKTEKSRNLIDDIYLIKAYDINRKVNFENYMSKGSFLCFFTNLKKSDQFDGKNYITAKNIYKSGMIYNFDKYINENKLEPTREVFADFKNKYYQEVSEGSYYDFIKVFEQAMTTSDNDTIK